MKDMDESTSLDQMQHATLHQPWLAIAFRTRYYAENEQIIIKKSEASTHALAGCSTAHFCPSAQAS